MKIFKNTTKNILIFLIISILFFIALIGFYIQITQIEHITTKTNIINNTDSNIAYFNIYIKYKSKDINDINYYKNPEEGIYYYVAENIKNTNINLVINSINSLVVSNSYDDNINKYSKTKTFDN